MSLEDVDRLILFSIGSLGCDVEELHSMHDVPSATFIEAVVLCLRRIKPALQIPSTKLPPAMTARFRFATELATYIKDLGYRGDIGYQTLLYASDVEVRRLLMFLIDKLPKDTSAQFAAESSKSPLDAIRSQVADELSRVLDTPWIPWFCRRYDYSWDGSFWIQETSSRESAYALLNDDWSTPSVLGKPLLPPKPQRGTKPVLAPKPDYLRRTSASISEEKAAESETNKQHIQALQAQLAKLHYEYAQIQSEVDRLRGSIESMHSDEVSMRASVQKMREAIAQKGKFAIALQNPEEAIKKLEEHLSNSDTRMSALEEQWRQVSEPLTAEIQELKEKLGYKSHAQQMKDEVQVMDSKKLVMQDESDSKEHLLMQLQREFGKIDTTVNRSAYTRRILDIVASIRKQSEEIAKILADTRNVQADIKSLTGKLGRTFAEADETVFREAKKDEAMRKSYKLVAALHEHCAAVTKCVEDTGLCLREMKDLEDQIDLESQRSNTSNLETLLNDYYAVKTENEQLEKQLGMTS